MEDKAWGDNLFALLLKLKSAFRDFLLVPDEHKAEQDAALMEMKRAAARLYQGIQLACAQGWTVVLYSHRGGGRRHEIRTPGPLNPDGITMFYSSQPQTHDCLSACVLLGADWLEVITSA